MNEAARHRAVRDHRRRRDRRLPSALAGAGQRQAAVVAARGAVTGAVRMAADFRPAAAGAPTPPLRRMYIVVALLWLAGSTAYL